jgi:hypothetical protein
MTGGDRRSFSMAVDNPRPIPYVTEDLESVPELLRDYYTEQDDGKTWRLLVNDVVPKETFQEFRNNNTNLNKEKAELERQMTVYKTINEDPDLLRKEYEELGKLRQRVKDKDLIAQTDFEKAVEMRTQEMKSASEGQIRALSEALNRTIGERDSAIKENEQIIISRAITDAALAAGAVPGAIPDILDRSLREGWVLNEKKIPIMMRNGTQVFGENGVDPLTPKEWATRSLRDMAPWFFNQASGTAATGSNASGGTVNPWTRDNWNITEQSKYILKEGMAKAEAMAAGAGSTVHAIHPPKVA